ncbi:lipopolysaccharide export system ATP-binding protein [Acidaminococcus fermentans]|uniref:ABC transporter related protein n=2 Tax=Acidaminococcus fermentans TaxID=905 RepID=D2RLT0_ACIFV|nr:LPS export ABC transporter ATP-binding protein [Acidaminococcus fermentans]ADB48032.1 ABC transporter related protein [Acidaminococcus fermentans DSM 20731]MCF0139567.1 LPS export ABC transporter ATP-binding protein [Acidaminococcus fermentans]MCI6286861.1 LPS export ABC transporter ATP-binding protein [Acidaminococcus fermentans]MCI7195256.1 LPS export ABC transporter ATP-binding protein [Acidaminococcus fermentans]MDD6288420.1 LPS export ABC transporter ATP-binding protein [Acidaminococcu
MKIRAEKLVKEYAGRRVVNEVSLEVEQGTIVGLLGPNGAGKTTSFYMIVGLEHPDTGHVYLDDEDVTHLPMYKRALKGIGYLPQEASIFRKLTVEENIMAILEEIEPDKAKRQQKMEDLIQEFHIDHIRKSKGSALSGGERRRVEIARALATDPGFILLDEPFAGIDPIAVADIQVMVAHLARRGIGVLITDHNVRETLSIVNRAYILSAGKILVEGTSQQVAGDPVARKFYLGDNFRM